MVKALVELKFLCPSHLSPNPLAVFVMDIDSISQTIAEFNSSSL